MAERKGKKLPKRTSRPAHKERRKACWLRGQNRKAQRRMQQQQAHARNISRGYSEWDLAKRKRLDKRKNLL